MLYIHHAGAFGGASRSLLELINGFPEDAVLPHLVTQRGSVRQVMTNAGVRVIDTVGISQLDHTRFSYYRGRRWLLLGRELLYLPFTLSALIHARVRWRSIDLVHVNELTALPAIFLARLVFARPVVVHVRSVQRPDDRGMRSRFIRWALRSCVAAVIAIDRTVARSLPDAADAKIIHNSFTPDIRAGDNHRPRFGDTGSGIARLRVGMVGNLLEFKGVHEFVEAARICHERRLNVQFALVGNTTPARRGRVGSLLARLGLLHDAGPEIRRYIAEHGLDRHIEIKDFTADISAVYRALDVLCFPSHLDAIGRPVYEAAFWKIPSIVAIRDAESDTMVHGETGLCIAQGDATALADAIEYFHDRPGEMRRMGEAASRLAHENFDSRNNAARVLEVYQRALARGQKVTDG